MSKKRYSYRAYPTPGQQRSLAQLFGCVRVVFNDVIAERERARAAGEKRLPSSEIQSLLITKAKTTEQRSWLASVSATPLQQAVRDAELAYKNFFDSLAGKRKGKRVGKPRFKRRSERQAARFTRQAGFSVRSTTHGVAFLRVPKVGWVRFVLSRELPDNPSSVTVIREADGSYHLSFVVDVSPKEVLPASHPDRVAGIDVGLTDFAVIAYSDGTHERIDNPRHLRKSERALSRAQRELSRKKKGSQNRAKARLRVARLHSRVRRQRLDHAHQLAARLIRENQAISIETLSITGLVKTRLARSVSDAGWGQFHRLLEEKALEHGRTIVRAPRLFPSSQLCSTCGQQDGPKPLNVRQWACSSCDTTHDRDLNAALNLLQLADGKSESQNACGADVSLQFTEAIRDEAGTHRTDQQQQLAA